MIGQTLQRRKEKFMQYIPRMSEKGNFPKGFNFSAGKPVLK
jgi:hypothetical protein